MRAARVAVKPWDKTCSRCGRPTFGDLLDEKGLCDYCREIVAMKSARKKKDGLRTRDR
jgi:CRISPR/Cas system-associated protein Cas10 (large subunit of type III CRISPR-Cas system)